MRWNVWQKWRNTGKKARKFHAHNQNSRQRGWGRKNVNGWLFLQNRGKAWIHRYKKQNTQSEGLVEGSYTRFIAHGTAWSTKFLQTSTEKRQFTGEWWTITLAADPNSNHSKAVWWHTQDAKASRLVQQSVARRNTRGDKKIFKRKTSTDPQQKKGKNLLKDVLQERKWPQNKNMSCEEKRVQQKH